VQVPIDDPVPVDVQHGWPAAPQARQIYVLGAVAEFSVQVVPAAEQKRVR
jgi:hypothetical protein